MRATPELSGSCQATTAFPLSATPIAGALLADQLPALSPALVA